MSEVGVSSVFATRGPRAAATREDELIPGLARKDPNDRTANGREAKSDASAEKEKARLRARDREVRAHEAAHLAAGGTHIRGGISFTYETGPDGKQYAVGGEVPIDLSPVPGNPSATIAKMIQVRAAALAPADPSGADIQVAASAQSAEAEARVELQKQNAEELGNLSGTGKPSGDTAGAGQPGTTSGSGAPAAETQLGIELPSFGDSGATSDDNTVGRPKDFRVQQFLAALGGHDSLGRNLDTAA